jgi:peroxin-11B
MIDALDVWLPAAGAELVNVNEGVLGILGFVRFIYLARALF